MKYGFETHLKIEKLNTRNYKLLEDLVFNSKKYGVITVRKGFVTDLASCSFGNFQLRGASESPSVLHDWLYDGRKVSRKVADDLFLDALRDERVSRWKAFLYWSMVRLFGSSHY